MYGERLRKAIGSEFRHWNPHRSKLCALATKDNQTPWLDPKEDILYLGASTGDLLLEDRVEGRVEEVGATVTVKNEGKTIRIILPPMSRETR